jgi:hypothetical protein
MKDNYSTIIAIIFLCLMLAVAFLQRNIIVNLREEAITRGYAEKVIEKDEIVFKWK